MSDTKDTFLESAGRVLSSGVLASFPVSTPSFFSHVVKKALFLQHAKKKLGVETGNEATGVHSLALYSITCSGMFG